MVSSQKWMIGDVYFGEPGKPAIDWRAEETETDFDDDAEPTKEDLAGVRAVLGFDPAELWEDEDDGEPTDNIFCNTGAGGGVDPSCKGTRYSATETGSGQPPAPKQLATRDEIYAMKPKAVKALADQVGLGHLKVTTTVMRGLLARKLETDSLVPKAAVSKPVVTAPKPASTGTVKDHGEAVLSAFKQISRYNQASIADIQAKTGLPLSDVHAAIQDLRRRGIVTASQMERADDRLYKASIKEENSMLAYIGLRGVVENALNTKQARTADTVDRWNEAIASIKQAAIAMLDELQQEDMLELAARLQAFGLEEIDDEEMEAWGEPLLDLYYEGLESAYDEVRPDTFDVAEFLRGVVENAETFDFIGNARKIPPRDTWGQFMSAKAAEMSERLAAGWKQEVGVVSQEIAKVVTNGIAEGKTPAQIKADIRALSVDIPEHRAAAIAVTESTRARAEGQLEGYRRLGVKEVGSDPEVELQLRSKNPCPECIALSKLTFPIERAVGMIPVHPNCLCRWKYIKPAPTAIVNDRADQQQLPFPVNVTVQMPPIEMGQPSVTVQPPNVVINNPISLPAAPAIVNEINVPEQPTPVPPNVIVNIPPIPPTPIEVKVEAPSVTIEPPNVQVDVAAPEVNVAAPVVTVEAPNVTVEAPNVINRVTVEPAEIKEVKVTADVKMPPTKEAEKKVVKVEKQADGSWTGTVEGQ